MKDHFYERQNIQKYNTKQYDRAEGKYNSHINKCYGLNSPIEKIQIY